MGGKRGGERPGAEYHSLALSSKKGLRLGKRGREGRKGGVFHNHPSHAVHEDRSCGQLAQLPAEGFQEEEDKGLLWRTQATQTEAGEEDMIPSCFSLLFVM